MVECSVSDGSGEVAALAETRLDLSSGVPLYRQIRDILRSEIIDGTADPAIAMTEAQLLDRFGVSRAPIRQALKELTNEGYVFRKQGKGTFPLPGVRVARPADVRLGGLYQYLYDLGLNPDSTVTGLRRAVPPAQIRQRLELADAEEELLHFTRLISVDGDPLVEAEVWVRAPEGFDPTVTELQTQGSALDLLEQQFGIAWDRAEHEAWAMPATAHHAASLGVDVSSPVLVIETTFYATGGVPAGWRLAAHKAARFKHHFVTGG